MSHYVEYLIESYSPVATVSYLPVVAPGDDDDMRACLFVTEHGVQGHLDAAHDAPLVARMLDLRQKIIWCYF